MFSILTASPDCATAERMFVRRLCGRLSIIPQISTTRGVANRRYARNALSKSNDPNRRLLIWFPNRRLVLTVSRSISEWYTPRPLGRLGSVVTDRCVFSFSLSASGSGFLTLYSQTPPSWPDSPKGGSPSSEVARSRRRKSFGADSPEVVTIGKLISLFIFAVGPDWMLTLYVGQIKSGPTGKQN